jgi:uncharacterized protein YbbC (DUF1343 family)
MVKTGIDVLLAMLPVWKNANIGLVTNAAACAEGGTPTRKVLQAAGFNLVRLFSPEHGLDSNGADGAWMQDQLDPLTNLPVISLYGEKLAPTPSDLKDLDVLLFDIPDVGARFYTYLWTMTLCLECCAIAKKRFIILDRPNPLSGNLSVAEGPSLDESNCSSFVGRWAIPIRHSCTLGELANYFNATRSIGCSLEIIPCVNWKRNQFFSNTGLTFLAPSPALQHFDNLILYPGTCFLEATNLHEGRGTDQAFTVVGAHWLTPQTLIDALLAYHVSGVTYTSTQFISTTNKYRGLTCQAVQFTVTDMQLFRPVQFGLILLHCLKALYPNFIWEPYPTVANPTGEKHLERLVGIKNCADWFALPSTEFLSAITKACTISENWSTNVRPYLLYSS